MIRSFIHHKDQDNRYEESGKILHNPLNKNCDSNNSVSIIRGKNTVISCIIKSISIEYFYKSMSTESGSLVCNNTM